MKVFSFLIEVVVLVLALIGAMYLISHTKCFSILHTCVFNW